MKNNSHKWSKHISRKKVGILLILFLSLVYYFCLSSTLFNNPVSQVLYDKEDQLLGAYIANDGQWRFPFKTINSAKFESCIIEFEDKRFYRHPGFDIIGIGRAIRQNWSEKKIVSGASTISMQVIRLSRPGKKRTIFQKIIEVIKATRLEIAYSKKHILSLYSSNAPFGGNVVGLDAASWRYYAKAPEFLSWAESATLAVLPNSPSLIHPGKNRKALLNKRNRLLKRLHDNNQMDSLSYELSLEEELPIKPIPLPRLAPHLLHTAFKRTPHNKTAIHSTIDIELQRKVIGILELNREALAAKGIHNACVLVAHVPSQEVRSYVGNLSKTGNSNHEAVDIVQAPRSTGSILKPILNMLVLQEGIYLQNSIVSDIPTHLQGYNPENYKLTYDGVIPLNKALERSLNIPFIRVLQKYGLEKFHYHLKEFGFSHLNNSAKHYGLPLILGGAEASLWDLCSTYSKASKILSNYTNNNSLYEAGSFMELAYDKKTKDTKPTTLLEEAPYLYSSAIWNTFEAMKKLERPNSEGSWRSFKSARNIAWKTGTSFGFRDAWSIGITPEYVVGIWVGNADGEGRQGLIGVETAAPILFDIFRLLPHADWYDAPFDDMIQISSCSQSGYIANDDLCDSDTIWCSRNGIKAESCKFHKALIMDKDEIFQLNETCENPINTKQVSWFVLPPVEELYYKKSYPSYKSKPPFRGDCQIQNANISHAMQFIYPTKSNKIYVPKDLNGLPGKTVFKIAHRREEQTIHWHLDNTFIGSTSDFHHMELNPAFGAHVITAVDESGLTISRSFEILSK